MTDDMHELPAPVPLDALDPTRDVARFESIVRSIGAAAAARRASARASGTVLTAIGAWAVPAAAAAIVVLVGSLAAIVLSPRPVDAAPATFAESAGIPANVVAWALAPDAASSAATVMDAAPYARGAGR